MNKTLKTLKNILLSNLLFKEKIKREIKKYVEPNDNENDSVKFGYIWESIALNACISDNRSVKKP